MSGPSTRRGSRRRPLRGAPEGGCGREETGNEALPPAAPLSSLWWCSSGWCSLPARSSSCCRRCCSGGWGCRRPPPRRHAWKTPDTSAGRERGGRGGSEGDEGQRENREQRALIAGEILIKSPWNLAAGVNRRDEESHAEVKSPLRKRRIFPGGFEDSLQVSRSFWGQVWSRTWKEEEEM